MKTGSVFLVSSDASWFKHWRWKVASDGDSSEGGEIKYSVKTDTSMFVTERVRELESLKPGTHYTHVA
jgi:hypothetical protein